LAADEPRVLERAFDLARSGQFNDMMELERALKREGFQAAARDLNSPSLRKQLLTAMKAAKP
jgi:predicted metal-binding protein